MNLLVIKEDVRSECAQDRHFLYASQEEADIDVNPPGSQSLDCPDFGRAISSCDQGNADRGPLDTSR